MECCLPTHFASKRLGKKLLWVGSSPRSSDRCQREGVVGFREAICVHPRLFDGKKSERLFRCQSQIIRYRSTTAAVYVLPIPCTSKYTAGMVSTSRCSTGLDDTNGPGTK